MSDDPSFRVLSNKLCALASSDRELSQGAKVLLGKIAMLADWAQSRTGLCFPGYERLAALVGRSVRMIGRYLSELRERGYLNWSRRQRCPNVYFLNFERVSADPPGVPEKFPLANQGYPFAGGRLNLRGVRELLRGAAAVQAGVEPVLRRPVAPQLPLELVEAPIAPLPKLSAAAFGSIMRGLRHG